MHIMLILPIMLIALSSTIWISVTYAKFAALDAWELLQPMTATETEFSVKKLMGNRMRARAGARLDGGVRDRGIEVFVAL